MIDDVQHYNVSTDMGVPCLILLASFFTSFSHLSLKYLLSHYNVQARG